MSAHDPQRDSADQPGAGEPTGWARQVRESHALFLAIAEQSPVMIWRSGRDARCDYFNQRWLEFTGRTLEQEQGDGWAEGVHPDDLQQCIRTYHTAFERRESFEMEYRLRRHDGEYRWILDRAGPYYDERGEFLGYLGACIDLHERKRLEEELRRANQAKDEFLALLSHELRTPLQPILTAAQTLLLRHRGDPQWERGLQLIERNARRQARMVEDLIEVSRIMRDRIVLEQALVDLAAVAAASSEAMRAAATGKGHELGLNLSPGPLPVVGDRARLAQVLKHLLDNAIKYTEPGGRITLTAVPEGAQAVVRVEDTGIGIDPAALPRLFELFAGGEPAQQRSQEGLGVGLAIVRCLVERQGGSVTVTSEGLGRGSCFTVRLPLAEQAALSTPSGGCSG